jgi:hypothetical protein
MLSLFTSALFKELSLHVQEQEKLHPWIYIYNTRLRNLGAYNIHLIPKDPVGYTRHWVQSICKIMNNYFCETVGLKIKESDYTSWYYPWWNQERVKFGKYLWPLTSE